MGALGLSDFHQPGSDDATTSEVGSILVVDLGEDVARAHLFDLVEGTPRFVATADCTTGTDPAALLRQLEMASARRLIEPGALISPQRADGDGVDHVFHIIDSADDDGSPPIDVPLLANAEKIDRGTAGRTALDTLATRLGRILLAIDFDLDAARSTQSGSDQSGGAVRDYRAIREAVAGFREQLDVNGGRSRVNAIDIGPGLLAGPLEATVLAIVDGCALQAGSGMITLASDREGLLLPLGAIAALEPDYAGPIFEHDFLSPLGTYLAIEMPEGQGAAELSGTLTTGEGNPVQHFNIPSGSLHRVDLERGASAELTLELPAGARFGTNPPGEAVRLMAPAEITGGALGIIIDTRPHDVDLPVEPASVSRWLSELRNG